MKIIGLCFRTMRTHQYVKNIFIFFPLFFAGQALNSELVLICLQCFLAFSFCASALYIFNDFKDRERDRNHPEKKLRPLASGAIKPPEALLLAVTCLVLGVSGMWFVAPQTIIFLMIYLIQNIAYSFFLKHIPIVDITVISVGFVLRLFVGASAVGVPLSEWIIIMTFLGALFIALAKRRDDILVSEHVEGCVRPAIQHYNLNFIDSSLSLMGSVIVVAYLMYTIHKPHGETLNSPYLYLTTVFVVLGLLRYLQLTFVKNLSGSPTQIVLSDLPTLFIAVSWLVSYSVIIYG